MTPSSSCYNLKSSKDYSDALESIRMISKAVSLVEQGNIVGNFSVYEEAFEKLGQSLAAAKTKGNLGPQLQRANAKLEGLIGQLSQRVELASARVKQATSASFATRMIDWVSAKAPKEQVVTVAKTAGNAGQWAWSHKKTVVGGAVLGAAIYNDVIGVIRTAVATGGAFWKFVQWFPSFISQFQQQSEEFTEDLKEGAANFKESAEKVVFTTGVGQELLRKNIEKCRNGESVGECADFVVNNFEAMKDCLPSANDPFDLKKWFWCVDNKISGGNTSSVDPEQFQDERTSQVMRTALSIFAQVSLARLLGIKIPGGELFHNYVGPWIVPNIVLSSVYPQYMEDVKTYCASHPVLCTAAGGAAVFSSWQAGLAVAVGGTGLRYVDQQFFDGMLNNGTQKLFSDPMGTGQQIGASLLETPELSAGLAAGLPAVYSAVCRRQKEVLLGTGVAALAARLDVAKNALARLIEDAAVTRSIPAANFAAKPALVAARLQANRLVSQQNIRVQQLAESLSVAKGYIPSWKTATMLGAVGFFTPKIVTTLYSAASESDGSFSGMIQNAGDHVPTLIVPQVVIDNGWTITTTAVATFVAGVLPRLLIG